MIKVKTLLKLGAAILVGAAVFVGSMMGNKKEKTSSSSGPQGGSSTTENDKGTMEGNGLKDIQGIMVKVSQFITTMITVFDSVSRLFSVEPVPTRYSSSTLIL